jgi:leucyl/phenylalanyl-tRNA---protein transferase
MIPWIVPGVPFPPATMALKEPNGLLAASSPTELTAERLVQAYQAGIFPWYCDGQPTLWWSPDPRLVLFTSELHVSRSLRKQLKSAERDPALCISADCAFETVMRACAAPRPGHDGTWITEPMVCAYRVLASRDVAHSVELWKGPTLIGGLYGVCLGRMFFGESMFSASPGASKIALAALVSLLRRERVAMIDCQQSTAHLVSLGARQIDRASFMGQVADAVKDAPIDWSAYRGIRLNSLLSDH